MALVCHDKYLDAVQRRKIRLIESTAKCLHLKKLTCKGTLRQVFICHRIKQICRKQFLVASLVIKECLSFLSLFLILPFPSLQHCTQFTVSRQSISF
jgi:hypothetical protein